MAPSPIANSSNSHGSIHQGCYDRGYHFRQILRRTSNSDTRYPSKLYSGGLKALRTALWEARKVDTYDKHKCFIPFDKLELARDRTLVEQILRDSSSIHDPTIPGLLDNICSDPHQEGSVTFFRIFAILVLCKKIKYIGKFIELKVDDSYLPLPAIERKGNGITISRHKHEKNRPLIESKAIHAIFDDEDDWEHGDLNSFYTHQWWVIAPFLAREERMIPHYILEANDILPFTRKERVPPPELNIETQDGEEPLDTDELLSREGGFGDVSIVKIHPSHYDFGYQPYSGDSHSFALKRLKSPNANAFQLEVDGLRKYNDGIEKHLIPLLATIEKEDDAGKYYLLFPEASGDLQEFWKTQFSQSTNKLLLRWMAEQCLGLTRALSMLHRDQDSDKNEDYPVYGRHGDIKAANILWFATPGATDPSGWRLVLSDFGLMRFHRLVSRSIQTSRNLKKTITYQAPEFDIAKISRKSDIWALGCTFLEFITCYISGYEAVDKKFPSDRGEYDERLKFDADKFYHTTNGGKGAELKPSVKKWISQLHRNSRCSTYLHEFLYYIENSMLCIERDLRPSASQVTKSLESFLSKCGNESYFSETSSAWEDR
ncbi:hypothetical protein Hte_002026 [Hypoxylon texense]